MNTKTTNSKSLAAFELKREAVTDDDIERYLKDHHDEIAAKLEEGLAEIDRGEAVPLEPLHVLLREARRHSKASR